MTGLRKPSVSKSISARTTGRVKRSVKRAANPFYGKRGTGFITNPKRSVKNAVYHRTTTGGLSSIKRSRGRRSNDDIVPETPITPVKKLSHWIIGLLVIAVAIIGGFSVLGSIGAIIAGSFVATLVISYLLLGG